MQQKMIKSKIAIARLTNLIVAICLQIGFQITAQSAENIILVTGFEPFGGGVTNSSWEAVKPLAGKHYSHADVVIAQLPVVWGEAEAKLRTLIKIHQPKLVVSFGQAGSEPVRLETTARNHRGSIPDNKAALPDSEVIDAQSPATLDSTLPLAIIENHLREADIPVRLSEDAGTYLCNAIFYALMNNPVAEWAKSVPRGFIHLPPLGTSVKTASGKTIIFDKALLAKTAAIIVETSAARLEDARLNIDRSHAPAWE